MQPITRRSTARRTRAIRALDLFAGVGGSSAGAIAAGVRVVGAIDCSQVAKDTYKLNYPQVHFLRAKCENVKLGKLKRRVGAIDLIMASPECTSHTCAKGKARRSEASRRTAFQVIRFARAFKPRWVIVENVVHMRNWKSFPTWLEELENLGYQVTQQVLNSADHGVPQARRRLFIMCDRCRVPGTVEPGSIPKKAASSVVRANAKFRYSLLRTAGRARATIQRAKRALAVLGTNRAFLLVYYGSDAAGGWQSLSVPLRTLTTLDRFAYVKPSSEGHKMRMLQVPELQRAMGFRASLKFADSTRRNRVRLLGNAVCPPVMKAVIRSLTRKATTEPSSSV
jgi:DNA (cytosine-5)-methyltransferase 1